MTLLNRLAVMKGAAVAIVICLPVALVSNVVHDHDPESSLLMLLFAMVTAGFGVAGYVAARAEGDAPYTNGAFAALVGFVVIQTIAIIVRVAGGRSLRVGTMVGGALIAYAAGILGAAIASRKATRP